MTLRDIVQDVLSGEKCSVYFGLQFPGDTVIDCSSLPTRVAAGVLRVLARQCGRFPFRTHDSDHTECTLVHFGAGPDMIKQDVLKIEP